MEVTYLNKKELKKNGNWRCYFSIKENGQEWYQHIQIENKGETTKKQLQDAATRIENSILQYRQEKSDERTPEYKLRQIAKELKSFNDQIIDTTDRTKISELISLIEAKYGD